MPVGKGHDALGLSVVCGTGAAEAALADFLTGAAFEAAEAAGLGAASGAFASGFLAAEAFFATGAAALGATALGAATLGAAAGANFLATVAGALVATALGAAVVFAGAAVLAAGFFAVAIMFSLGQSIKNTACRG